VVPRRRAGRQKPALAWDRAAAGPKRLPAGPLMIDSCRASRLLVRVFGSPRSDRLVTDEPNLRQSQEAPRVFLAVRGTGWLALAGAAPVVAAATPAPRRVRVSVRFMPNIQLTNFTSAHSGMSRRRSRLRGVAAGRRGEGDRTDRVRAARRPLLDLRVVRPQPTRLPVFVNSKSTAFLRNLAGP
jgi:hypothetical protein